jgi:hypothetical protein
MAAVLRAFLLTTPTVFLPSTPSTDDYIIDADYPIETYL